MEITPDNVWAALAAYLMPNAPVVQNMSLPQQNDPGYVAWLKANGITQPLHPQQHYDLYSAYVNGLQRQGQLQHFSDQYKLPGHETFSNQSQYWNWGMPGGQWIGGLYARY